MTFRATPEDVANAMAAQAKVLSILCEYHDQGWMESRDLIRYANPGITDGELNFREKKHGDLTNSVLGMAMEVQHSERTDNCLWMHSKYLHCTAEWQCFSFKKHNAFLVVPSRKIRDYIEQWNVKPTHGVGDSFYTLGIDWLLKEMQAVDLIEWCESQRIPVTVTE